jgi:hypothetical protein
MLSHHIFAHRFKQRKDDASVFFALLQSAGVKDEKTILALFDKAFQKGNEAQLDEFLATATKVEGDTTRIEASEETRKFLRRFGALPQEPKLRILWNWLTGKVA